ncbi:Possible enoyl-CoA hydratase/isomerase [Mycobacteroides abscessus]|nr:Possible enoyl-CoA hydratase/isomerase [Mycobacteroides abscessus]
MDTLKTMTYEVTDRVARITFNRPEQGNAIIADTPLELAALVERADLDPQVHVILVSGRGDGFCGGFDLSAYAEANDEGSVGIQVPRWTGRCSCATTCPTSIGIRCSTIR